MVIAASGSVVVGPVRVPEFELRDAPSDGATCFGKVGTVGDQRIRKIQPQVARALARQPEQKCLTGQAIAIEAVARDVAVGWIITA